eukprot:16367-Heterococcus_DN1.PRE.5
MHAVHNRLVAGVKIRAIYADEENDPAWYEAAIDSVVSDEEGGGYWVTFPEYGNSALVTLGEIQLLDTKDQSRSRSRDPHRDRDQAERRDREREREAAKSSISVQLVMHCVWRHASGTPSTTTECICHQLSAW